MRTRLSDLATVIFLTSMSEETGKKIQKNRIERGHLIVKQPLYFLALVYEDRCFEYESWFDDILENIIVVESATGMTRNMEDAAFFPAPGLFQGLRQSPTHFVGK